MNGRSRTKKPLPPILEICNLSINRENWEEICTRFLMREGILSISNNGDDEALLRQLTYQGARVTYGNIEHLHKQFRRMFSDIASAGKFPPHHIELLNAALSHSRGLRLRLERVIPASRTEPETLNLQPKTFDFSLILHFAAASFLSGLDPKRLKQCPNCAMLFLLESKRRKRFCTDSCRSQYHNRIRVESGRQALYMRRRRRQIRIEMESPATK
ncbi:MAG: hypothetical protein V3U53_00450 [bacterium]